MSNASGAVTCDGCGKDVTPGSLELAARVLRANDDVGGIEELNFCTDRTTMGDDGRFPVTTQGCLSKLLVPENMQHYVSTHPDPEEDDDGQSTGQ